MYVGYVKNCMSSSYWLFFVDQEIYCCLYDYTFVIATVNLRYFIDV